MAQSDRDGRSLEPHPELGFVSDAVCSLAEKERLLPSDVMERGKIPKSSFYSLMQRKALPNLITFFRLADGLGVQPEALIGEMRRQETSEGG